MTAGVLDILVEQGATWTRSLAWETTDVPPVPISVVGYLARLMIRKTYRSDLPSLTLTSAVGGGITLTAPNQIDILMTATQTASLAMSTGVYDLELEAPDGTVTRLLQGVVTVSPEATR